MVFESIEKDLNYINRELTKGRSMKDIEVNDFNVKEKFISDKLRNKGYSRARKKNSIYIKSDELIQQYNNCISDNNETHNRSVTIVEDKTLDIVTGELPKGLDVNSLIELTTLIEPIKAIIQQYNNSINIIDVEPVELKVKKVNNIKQKLFKVDSDVLNSWEEFTQDNSQYRVQDLISLALDEFITKYTKK